MTKSSDDKKRDAVLKHMLQTPHKPHKPIKRKKAQPVKNQNRKRKSG
jgi:hypothetical protein